MDTWQKIVLILCLVLIIHYLVILIRRLSKKIMAAKFKPSLSKTRTVVSVVTSIMVFMLYFSSIGYSLHLMSVPVSAYIASASIIGLAVAFGSQGIVQDVVSGVTIILSDLFDIGEMVTISGQTGIVKQVGMRFTVLLNSDNADVYLPNRGIKHVINYPTGYSEYFVDIRLPNDEGLKQKFIERISAHVDSVQEMYPAIIRGQSSFSTRTDKYTEQQTCRVCFRLWPGDDQPIKNGFMKALYHDLKQYHNSLEEWMITLNLEIDRKRDPFKRK